MYVRSTGVWDDRYEDVFDSKKPKAAKKRRNGKGKEEKRRLVYIPNKDIDTIEQATEDTPQDMDVVNDEVECSNMLITSVQQQ